jgi:CMP-N,N'-diacetyllegionaminic acid synthase
MAGAPVVALVPARGGSTGIPNKNLADVAGFPLLAYSIRAGLLAGSIDRVIVTTDSEEIAEVGRAHGAEAPFLRPAELAADDSLDVDYVRHALAWLDRHEHLTPELVIQLRPTTPLRDPSVLDGAIAAIARTPEATGLRSVHQLQEPPQKMLGIEGGWLTGLFPHDPRPEYFNLPRQAFAPAYWPNGYIDVIRPSTVIEQGSLYGSRVLAEVTSPVVEIDGPEELEYVRYRVERSGHGLRDALAAGSQDG